MKINQKLTAVIIDDERHAREFLNKIILRVFPDHFQKIVITDSVQNGVVLINECRPDIVFLDIDMPDENGFELFKKFNSVDFEVVFTTAHQNFIMEAVNTYGCLGYLMKPIDQDDLRVIIDRFENKMLQKQATVLTDNAVKGNEVLVEDANERSEIAKKNDLLFFSGQHEVNIVKISDIIYCRASDSYCEFYTMNKNFTVSKPLKEIEKIINDDIFFRVHRSYLVNMNYVSSYDKKLSVLKLLVHPQTGENKIPVADTGHKKIISEISS